MREEQGSGAGVTAAIVVGLLAMLILIVGGYVVVAQRRQAELAHRAQREAEMSRMAIEQEMRRALEATLAPGDSPRTVPDEAPEAAPGVRVGARVRVRTTAGEEAVFLVREVEGPRARLELEDAEPAEGGGSAEWFHFERIERYEVLADDGG